MDITKSKLADFLNLIPAKKKEKFLDFLGSPYFQADIMEVELYHIVQKSCELGQVCEEEWVMEKLFPDHLNAESQLNALRKLKVRLLHHVQVFLRLEYPDHHPIAEIELLQLLNDSQCERQFQNCIKAAKSALNEGVRQPYHHLYAHDIEVEEIRYWVKRSRSRELPMQAAIDALDQFFVLQKLRLLSAQINYTRNLKKATEEIEEEEIDRLVQWAHSLVTSFNCPVIRLYLGVLEMQRNPYSLKAERAFLSVQKQLFLLQKDMPWQEFLDIGHHLLNFCIRQLNIDRYTYLEHFSSCFHSLEAAGLFAKDQGQSLRYQKILLTVAVKSGNMPLAVELLARHHINDPFLRGIVAFHQGDFASALSLFNLAKQRDYDHFFKVNIRCFLVMTFLELLDIDSFEAHNQALIMFARRNKEIPVVHRERVLNFTLYMRKLFKLQVGLRSVKSDFLIELRNQLREDRLVYHKSWLLAFLERFLPIATPEESSEVAS